MIKAHVFPLNAKIEFPWRMVVWQTETEFLAVGKFKTRKDARAALYAIKDGVGVQEAIEWVGRGQLEVK